jgi:hypothetical protein
MIIKTPNEPERIRMHWDYLLDNLSTGIGGPDHQLHEFCKEGIGRALLTEPKNTESMGSALRNLQKLYDKYSLKNCGYFLRYNYWSGKSCKELGEMTLSKMKRIYKTEVVMDKDLFVNSKRITNRIMPYFLETRIAEGYHYSKGDKHFLDNLIQHLTTRPFPNAVNFDPHISYGNILPFSDGKNILYTAVCHLTSGITFQKPTDSKPLPVISLDIKEEKPFADLGKTSVDFIDEVSENFRSSGVPVIPFENMVEISKRSKDIDSVDYVISRYIKT